MNTIGTRVTSGVIESVKDEKTVITTCSAKTVKWNNVSQKNTAARRPNEQSLYSSIEAFVRDRNQGGLLPTLLRVSVNDVVELARSEIRPRIVEDLSGEELIQRISTVLRDASRALQVVPDEIPIVARAGSGGDSSISSLSMHQAEGNFAVELENRSIATISADPAAQPADDDVIAARLLLTAETVSTSSSGRALSPHQPPQNEDQTDETDDERKQPAQKKPRVGE